MKYKIWYDKVYIFYTVVAILVLLINRDINVIRGFAAWMLYNILNLIINVIMEKGNSYE